MHEPIEIFGFAFIGAIFCFVLFMFAYAAYKGISEWHRNNKAPKVSLRVFVKGKNSESHVSQNATPSSGHDGHSHSSASTTVTRTITFEDRVSSERLVFDVGRAEFDLIFDGDKGTLLYQGTRFLAFKRDRG